MSPTTTLWALLGLATSLGILLIILGALPRPQEGDTDTGRDRFARLKEAGFSLTRREQMILGATALAGLVIAILTGWVVALLALPAAGLMLPRIIGDSRANQRIAQLEALEEWTRTLSSVLHASTGLTEALTLTLRSAPKEIKPQVELLVTRLQARRPVTEALRQFADDLDDPTGDLIAGALISGARQSGAGLTRILTGLATTVAAEVRVRRQIEADRSSPRTQAKVLILIAIPGMAAFLTLTPYGRAYSDPLGQSVLAVILAMFFGCLFWMHWITVAKPEPRFLVATEVD